MNEQCGGRLLRSGGRGVLFLSSGESRGTRAERPLQAVCMAASNDFRDASPVVPTDPPQAEGNMNEQAEETCCEAEGSIFMPNGWLDLALLRTLHEPLRRALDGRGSIERYLRC